MSEPELLEDSEEATAWWNEFRRQEIEKNKLEERKYIKVSRFPRELDSRSLTQLVYQVAKVQPKCTRICYKEQEDEGEANYINRAANKFAIIEFKSSGDAMFAMNNLKEASFTKTYFNQWRLELITKPIIDQPE